MNIIKEIKFIVSLITILCMAVQPVAASVPGNLSPCPVSAESPMTTGSAKFTSSVVSDAEFLGFAFLTYKTVVEEKSDIAGLFKKLSSLPFWEDFRFKAHLAKDFVSVEGDVLSIRFKDAGVARVIPRATHKVLFNGSVEDRIVPGFFHVTDGFVVQYLPKDSAGQEQKGPEDPFKGIRPEYLRIWEKARPYYEKARPADLVHISWMLLEAARIARVEGLDEKILLPIVILHDVGYASCLKDETTRSFDPDVKRKHMAEGAKIADGILREVGYDPVLRERIVRYVSVHDNWRFGDDTPFKECIEMAVFQDLDFTWMASKEGFQIARNVTFGKTPRQMYEFLMADEKLTKRPFATKETHDLFYRLMAERKLEVELEEASSRGDGASAQHMIGFGPQLSYPALNIDTGAEGIYITAAEEKVEKNKSMVLLSELEDLDPWTVRRLRKERLITAALILREGKEKLMEIVGTEQRAQKIIDTCNKPYYRKELAFVCRAEEGSPERAVQIAEMLNQGLYLLNCAKDSAEAGNRHSERLSEHLREIAQRFRNKKVSVEVATNLEANSASYHNKIVFNKKFIDFIYERWESHRIAQTTESWQQEMGALVMIAERLFHEMDHDADEIRQILNDLMYYKATIRDRDPLRDAVRLDVSLEVKVNGGNRTAPFGESFGTNAYFGMIYRIASMTDINEIRGTIREYLEATYRGFSSREVLGLDPEKVAYAEKLMKEHGVNDDLFGERIFGTEFDEFFAKHCLFSAERPYNHDYIDQDQRREWSRVYRLRVAEIREYILSTGRMLGSEERTQQWMDNRLRVTHIRGRDSTRKKLYPLIKWAVAVRNPQNFQKRRGKLFDRLYYKGLNLMTLPILPVDDNGEILWDLFRFDQEYSRWVAHEGSNRVFRAPPQEYYRVRKISLYEYLVTHDVPEKPVTQEKTAAPEKPVQRTLFSMSAEDEPVAEGETPEPVAEEKKPVKYVQGTLFDMDAVDDAGAVEEPETKVSSAGEYADHIEGDMVRIHQLNTEVSVKDTLGQVTHILIDRDIPAASQRDIVTYLAKRSRERMASEKIHFMSMDEMNAYIAGNPCNLSNTVVLLNDTSQLGDVSGEVNMLVVKKDGVTDFVNLEGLIGISRSVLNKDWDAFRQIYAAMTGEECPRIRPEWLSDPVLFARNIIIALPPVSIIDVEEQKRLNERLKELLVAA